MRSDPSSKKTDKVASMIDYLRNHKLISIFIFTGLIITGTAELTNAFSDISKFILKSDSENNQDSRKMVMLNSISIHSELLAKERGNIERCFQNSEIDSLAIIFEIGDGKSISNIYLYKKWINYDDSKFPAPQANLMKLPEWSESPIQGGENDCVLEIINRYRFNIPPENSKYYLPIYLKIERQ